MLSMFWKQLCVCHESIRRVDVWPSSVEMMREVMDAVPDRDFDLQNTHCQLLRMLQDIDVDIVRVEQERCALACLGCDVPCRARLAARPRLSSPLSRPATAVIAPDLR